MGCCSASTRSPATAGTSSWRLSRDTRRAGERHRHRSPPRARAWRSTDRSSGAFAEAPSARLASSSPCTPRSRCRPGLRGPAGFEWAFDTTIGCGSCNRGRSRPAGPRGHGPDPRPGAGLRDLPGSAATAGSRPLGGRPSAGVIGALHVTSAVGATPTGLLARCHAVGGRVVADLELFGIVPGAACAEPSTRCRGTPPVAAWRVGRLRSALAGVADDLTAGVDRDLQATATSASSVMRARSSPLTPCRARRRCTATRCSPACSCQPRATAQVSRRWPWTPCAADVPRPGRRRGHRQGARRARSDPSPPWALRSRSPTAGSTAWWHRIPWAVPSGAVRRCGCAAAGCRS